MPTTIYGASNDLIEIEGDVKGETAGEKADRQGRGTLLICSDGTLLNVSYGKSDGSAIWNISIIKQGVLLTGVTLCSDEDAKPPSDVAHFEDGLKHVYAARKWERVR